ncbi:MAG: polysaccharide lyase family 8 super-sandwich domain-containing protein [Prolixibacteraceae bacterium]
MKHMILILVFLMGFPGMKSSLAGNNQDLELLRKKVTAELLLQKVDEPRIKELMSTLREDGSWPGINYTDLSRIGYENVRHLNNIWVLSSAYRSSGTPFRGDKQLLAIIHKSLTFWTNKDFIAGNWHTNEISNPEQLIHILLVLDGDLEESLRAQVVILASRANLDAWGARPGGDLIKIAGIMAELALYNRDESSLQTAIDAMTRQVKITTGLGIKADLGFHHRVDRVTSILTYGTNYAATFSDWAYLFSGTRYGFPAEATHLLIDYYIDGISKSMVHAWYRAPGLINRDMSRKGALGPVDNEIPLKLSLVSDYRKQELENIVKIRNGAQKPNLTYNKFFWHSEYAIHQRPGYYSTVRMFSNRNYTMEFPHNMESLKHHHYADGANFISVTGKEYSDIFPVWDWQKIPGTTVVQRPSLPPYTEIVKKGKTGFVGAVTDGTYGASSFDFESPLDPLRAKKAWFFFDKEYVCLGAGITSSSDFAVNTTINQCLLKGEVRASSGKDKTTLSIGEHQLNKADWVIHDGIAYVFPNPTDVLINNKTYSGNWHDLVSTTRKLGSDLETKDLFSLWIDHGKQPKNAAYAYIVAPGIDISKENPARIASRVKILSNTSQVQAVHQLELNITQIVFYEPGTVALNNGLKLSALNPCMVMLKSAGDQINEITVADPGRKLKSLNITVPAVFTGSGANWKTVGNKKQNTTDITFKLPSGDFAGQSMTIRNNTFDSGSYKENIAANAESGKIDQPVKSGIHQIGEHYGGGIVFWTDETGTHGLIASTTDQSDAIQWRNGPSKASKHYGDHGDRVVNARKDGIGAGEMNTMLIIAQMTDDDITGNFAAKTCSLFEQDGYGDWYLPSKSELNKMYQNKDLIGGFGNDMYWSSTELNVGFAWCQNFTGYGGQFNQNKSSACAVRCIRRF